MAHIASRSKVIRTVAVFGHVGQDNLGDEGAFQAVIEAVKARQPEVEFVGVSVNPTDTSTRYGIRVLPIWRETPVSKAGLADSGHESATRKADLPISASRSRFIKTVLQRVPIVFAAIKWAKAVIEALPGVFQEIGFLVRMLKALRGIDVLAVAGSQHLNDYVLGPWNFPYTTFKWTLLAKCAGARVVLLNVGAGPLQTDLGKWFVKKTILWSDYQSYRDDSSIRCVRQLGVGVSGPSLPDMVFSLSLRHREAAADSRKAKLVVGINPIPFNSGEYWVGGSQENYWRYLGVLSEFTQWLFLRGYAVSFFPTQLTLDPVVIRDLRSLLPVELATSEYIAEASIKTVDDLAAMIQKLDFVVASRFHGLVFSALFQKPMVGIAYAEKTKDLLAYMGVGEYAVDIETLTVGSLQRLFESLEGRRESVARTLGVKCEEARRKLESQFDGVFR